MGAVVRVALVGVLVVEVVLLQLTGLAVADQISLALAALGLYGVITGVISKTRAREVFAEPMTSGQAANFLAGSGWALGLFFSVAAQVVYGRKWLGGPLTGDGTTRDTVPDGDASLSDRSALRGCLAAPLIVLGSLLGLLVAWVTVLIAVLGAVAYLVIVVPLASVVYLFVARWYALLAAPTPEHVTVTIRRAPSDGDPRTTADVESLPSGTGERTDAEGPERIDIRELAGADPVAFKSAVVSLLSVTVAFSLQVLRLF